MRIKPDAADVRITAGELRAEMARIGGAALQVNGPDMDALFGPRKSPSLASQNIKPKDGRYKGVHHRKRTGKWEVKVTARSRQVHIGTFDTEMEAAKAYDRAAYKIWGAGARLNFPLEIEDAK